MSGSTVIAAFFASAFAPGTTSGFRAGRSPTSAAPIAANVGVSGSGPVPATGPELPTSAPALSHESLEGILRGVDGLRGLLTVELDGAARTFSTLPTTRISRDGQEVELADCQVGDPVRIRLFTTRGPTSGGPGGAPVVAVEAGRRPSRRRLRPLRPV